MWKLRGNVVVGWDVVPCCFGGTCCSLSNFPKDEDGSFLRNVGTSISLNVVTPQNDVAHHSFSRSLIQNCVTAWINAEWYKTNSVFFVKDETSPHTPNSCNLSNLLLIAELDFYDPVGLVPDCYLHSCNLSLTGIQGRCEDIGTGTLTSPVFLSYGWKKAEGWNTLPSYAVCYPMKRKKCLFSRDIT